MLPWISRAIVVVLDGAGLGALPDAHDYGDAGANTLGHVAETAAPHIPTLRRLGLGNISGMAGLKSVAAPQGAFGRLAELSVGKDSTVGHWELTGVVSSRAYPTYPEGFPPEIIGEFARRTGRGVLGNRPASGTQIIQELAEEHLRTGGWIVYTSADSVFQVAAHEAVIPLEELYAACDAAADMLMPRGLILRVIARPFAGAPGHLCRTAGRRDINMPAPGVTVLDRLAAAYLPVVTIGKVDSVFAGRAITEALHTADNREVLSALRDELEFARRGLVLANLTDFDMLYGHRRDVVGFARALEEADAAFERLLGMLRPRDLLFITADHGCDPTSPGTDHTREYVPILVAGQSVRPGVDLGTRTSFADLGATVCEALGIPGPDRGSSFWRECAAPVHRRALSAQTTRDHWDRRRDLFGGCLC